MNFLQHELDFPSLSLSQAPIHTRFPHHATFLHFPFRFHLEDTHELFRVYPQKDSVELKNRNQAEKHFQLCSNCGRDRETRALQLLNAESQSFRRMFFIRNLAVQPSGSGLTCSVTDSLLTSLVFFTYLFIFIFCFVVHEVQL